MRHLPGGENFSQQVPAGDDRERMVCDECGWVHYVNPKIVVGAVCRHGDKVLLCRRAIEPRRGFWTIPAGFMEERETSAEGAAREAWEEAGVELRMGPLLAVYNIPRISQVQLIYKAELAAPGFEAGPESLEVALFDFDEIPWDELAFPSVRWALDQVREVWDRDDFATFGNPPGETGRMTPP
ncbi:NUDIX hydrolase [Minwuia thermotolerans]|uniref:NUDIX hydrolase n=1 Tax=Minwuia thermotolerans TaxID=2056226 RepID=A0A2M9G5P6_9PROT|nr:NUDIX hydrolase [Minwuia thermotolerans]ANK83301.1 MAG: NUDIX hydrolase [Rhizobiales bacterium NRL2]PJK31024.1 NUDIX hydrolase [Minwuia thermotolerans]